MANYKSFTNRECEFYPCHRTERLNCLFCFCPLYFLDCGGSYSLTSRGLKDCSDCLLPHSERGYDYIVQRLTDVTSECYPERAVEPAGMEEADTGDPEPICIEATEENGRPD